MNKPILVPISDGMFEIEHSFDRDEITVDSKNPEKTAKLCEAILAKYPYDFEAALILGRLYNKLGEFEKACQVRYEGFGRLAELIGDEEIELDAESDENLFALELALAAAIDHFLISDFEMSAAMLELLLELDPEDHLGATRFLSYCYVALGEWELFEETLFDIDDKSAEKAILEAWGRFNQNEIPAAKEALNRLKHKFADIYSEFAGDSHEVTENYLMDIESDRPTNAALARELWLQTEHIWNAQPEFLKFLKEI